MISKFGKNLSWMLLNIIRLLSENLNDEPKKVSVHIFDEYWDILNKRNRRKINTIHLNGEEKKL